MADTHNAITLLLDRGVREGVFPAAVWATGDADTILDVGACGLADPAVPTSAVGTDTLWDVASLTKIVAAWSVIGILWHDQQLPLDDPLKTLWPEVVGYPLGHVTARHLLTHTAGVPLRANLRDLYGTDPQAIRNGSFAKSCTARRAKPWSTRLSGQEDNLPSPSPSHAQLRPWPMMVGRHEHRS
ncbi:serine hydrolase domain-containing protein [Nonomuraea sp. NPDC049158]|uniref:serine hydrolase domain-containing protein n=1 Tax=Nonomuraea sp. NPDC049158 TaxID=3155649 RepID=UPI003404696B